MIKPLTKQPATHSALLLKGLLVPLLLISGCAAVKDDNTLSSLEQTSLPIKDEQVTGSLEKAMENYREYLQQAPASKKTPEAMRRLANLEVDKNYHISGLEAPPESGARAAIKYYTNLLSSYPMYDHNDRVLYQLSRAYNEVGELKNAAAALEKLATSHPDFERIDEVKFRLGEYYFSNKEYEKAGRAYSDVIVIGKNNTYYEVTLNKLGWSYFKQDRYKQALTHFITLLDHLVDKGYFPGNAGSQSDNKQLADTFHAISLSFSYLGGVNAITTYLNETGQKIYDTELYKHLAEYYLSRKRYSDAANTYQAHIDLYPSSETSPYLSKRIIEIYQLGEFTNLAIAARKRFSADFDPRADYWKKSDPDDHPLILEFLKSNIHTLASYYHARYKKLRTQKDRHDSYTQAIHWYREYYYLFPLDEHAPAMGKLLAELFLENRDYRSAALEFERTAYNYPTSEIASESGYAAIFAYRENLKSVTTSEHSPALEEVTRSSHRFVDNFPGHVEASAVLTAAANDLLTLKNYSSAANAARRVVTDYPNADKTQLRAARMVMADTSFESGHYEEAEKHYSWVLAMTDISDKKRPALIENLAASIYKQGEQARTRSNHDIAAEHFLRISTVAPTASVRISAQYDAAAALVTAENWPRAASVLEDFLKHNPTHKLADVTSRNLAVIYRKNEELLKSAAEFERIGKNNNINAIRRDALLQAADLYWQANNVIASLRVYERYVRLFPTPVEDAIESYQQIADIYKSTNDRTRHHEYLNKVISADKNAGNEKTNRTRYLAAQALLVLAETELSNFDKVKLSKPFKRNLDLKKKRMASAIKMFTRLLDYQVDEVTTAATFYIAEIYLQFSHALVNSERPSGLNELELEQYELALEEQVYLFEEKAINVHEKNTELLDAGIYDPWIVKSIDRLTELFPARYAKQEQNSGFLINLFAQDDRT